ncbi:MAG: hypothetical protein WC782_16715 [Methylococcaceae bacterium]|jgi:hypothetical protein
MLKLLGLICLVLLFCVGYLRHKQKKAKRKWAKLAMYYQTQSWGYVIKPANEEEFRCPAALAMIDKPIAVDSRNDLPALPLANCNQKICRCRFEAMPERRSNVDRRTRGDRRFAIRYQDKIDRRSNTDRRKFNALWQKHRD